MEEWNNFPAADSNVNKRRKRKEKESYTPVPDSVIEARRMHDSMETYLDPRQQVLGGFETPSMGTSSLSAAREKVCFPCTFVSRF